MRAVQLVAFQTSKSKSLQWLLQWHQLVRLPNLAAQSAAAVAADVRWADVALERTARILTSVLTVLLQERSGFPALLGTDRLAVIQNCFSRLLFAGLLACQVSHLFANSCSVAELSVARRAERSSSAAASAASRIVEGTEKSLE